MRTALLALLLIGCAPYRWLKPGASAEERRRDQYECEKDARWTREGRHGRSSVEMDDGMYERCMEARGYRDGR